MNTRRSHDVDDIFGTHSPTCPSVPTFTSASSSKAHLPTSAPHPRFQTPQSGIRPVIRPPSRRRTWSTVIGFPSSFDHRHSLLGHPVPPGIPPRLLSAYHHRAHLPAHPVWTQTRVYHVPHA